MAGDGIDLKRLGQVQDELGEALHLAFKLVGDLPLDVVLGWVDLPFHDLVEDICLICIRIPGVGECSQVDCPLLLFANNILEVKLEMDTILADG